jgi:hypothetical protein
MKAKSTILSMAAAAAVVFTVVWSAQSSRTAAATAGAVRPWEHMAMTIDATDGPGDAETSRRIVQLGGEGWELVDVESLTKDGTTTKLIYFFKRPR